MCITLSITPFDTSTATITGVSKKTGRKIALSEVIFDADAGFFIEFAGKILDVLDAVYVGNEAIAAADAAVAADAKVDAPQDPGVAAAYEEALVQKLRVAVRELFGAGRS